MDGCLESLDMTMDPLSVPVDEVDGVELGNCIGKRKYVTDGSSSELLLTKRPRDSHVVDVRY